MSQSTVSYLWREPKAAAGFATGVSLHSHTCQSRETLDFIADLATDHAWMQPVIRWGERRSLRFAGIQPDYAKAFWTPPLNPRMAFELEATQIEGRLELPALVSLSDHDDISAPLLLRNLPSARHIPVSTEWSVPYANPSAAAISKPTAFHLGVHNLPSGSALGWIARLNEFTALDPLTRRASLLGEMLAELDALPNVLIVFNHPLWDLFRIGDAPHQILVNDFLAQHGQYLHALELNGLRNWEENSRVRTLAAQWNQLVISGGDRHGIEPNANVNLSHAGSFSEFVHEVRRDRVSHVLFMPQYRQPWKHRILQSTLDAVRNHPGFPEGSRRWDERVFAADADGEIRQLATLWRQRHPPLYISAVISIVRLMGSVPVSQSLKVAWSFGEENNATPMYAALTE